MSVEVEVGGVYEQASDLTPTGTIVAFGGTNAPAGWYLCDGTAKNRNTDIRLFDVIGTNFGEGDGSQTFNLPDLRGQFLRGLDDRSTGSLDPDASSRKNLYDDHETLGSVVGSYQDDAIRNITGYGRVATKSRSATDVFYYGTNYGEAFDSSSANGYDSLLYFDASRVVPTGRDNRPKNIAVNYIIKN